MGRPRKYATEQDSPPTQETPTEAPSIDVVADVQRVRILSDRIEYLNPTIEFTESVWVTPKELTTKIRPNRATVSQGVLIVDEFNLTIGMTGVRIRTA